MEITLKFNIDNNFDIISKRHVVEDKDIIINACWVVGCAMKAIEDCYEENSPRRLEMEKIYQNLKRQIRDQITEEQYQETYKHFRDLEQVK